MDCRANTCENPPVNVVVLLGAVELHGVAPRNRMQELSDAGGAFAIRRPCNWRARSASQQRRDAA
eukprot:5763762-Lingulodinium_polyedra.AAC.1